MRQIVLLALLAISVMCLAGERHALLVGVDEYEQTNFIRPLKAAGADAEALGKALGEVSQVKPDHLRILTSKSGIKPTNTNILYELEQLGKNVSAGDTVYFFFSGHGVEIGGTTYLLPSNCDSRTEATLRLSAIPTSAILSVLSSLKASNLILVFDMCRSDPLRSSRDADPRAESLTERQIRELVMTPNLSGGSGTKVSAPEARQVVTFFSCSPGQKSYEWGSKNRGYFSYFFEQALRGQASTKGEIRVGDLQNFVKAKVEAAVKQNENASQVPFIKLEGPNPVQFPLAYNKGPDAIKSDPGITPPSSPVLLRQKRKVGQTFVYDYTASMQDDRYKDDATISGKISRTTKQIKDNGDYIVDNGTVELTMKMGGRQQKMAAQPAVPVTYNALGRVLGMAVPKGGDEWSARRIINLESLYLPSQPLRLGGSWQVELPAEPGKSVAGRGSYSLDAIEKVNGEECYRISGMFEETEGALPASETITFWISVDDGIVMRQEGTMINSPLPKSMQPSKSKTTYRMVRV